MTIHHSQIKKAEKLGIMLEEGADDAVIARWPKRALVIVGASAGDALAQMQAAIAVCDGDEYRMTGEGRLVITTRLEDESRLVGSPMTAVEAHKLIKIQKSAVWGLTYFAPDGTLMNADGTRSIFDDVDAGGDEDLPDVELPYTGSEFSEDLKAPAKVERAANGVALNGAIAYAEGTPAGDCPYNSEAAEDDEDNEEYDNFLRWNEEWDNAADAADAEKPQGGSVVAEKYRAKYAELGHPTHCGDWLAELLNNLCLTKKDTDLGRFEAICAANGVDTSKYKRDGVGWQGRIRMTGRNLLAKKVYLAGGVLFTPVEGAEPQYQAPADWMQMQRFKMPKAEQSAPIPAPAAAA